MLLVIVIICNIDKMCFSYRFLGWQCQLAPVRRKRHAGPWRKPPVEDTSKITPGLLIFQAPHGNLMNLWVIRFENSEIVSLQRFQFGSMLLCMVYVVRLADLKNKENNGTQIPCAKCIKLNLYGQNWHFYLFCDSNHLFTSTLHPRNNRAVEI